MAQRRQRRERGSISVEEILNGAFDVAAEVSEAGMRAEAIRRKVTAFVSVAAMVFASMPEAMWAQAPPKPAPRRQPVFDDDDDFENQSWLR